MSGEPDRDGESAPHGGSAPHGRPDNWADVDIDAVFAEIIATYGQSAPRIGPWPVAEEVDSPDTSAPRASPPGRTPGTGPTANPASGGPGGTADGSGGFGPPDPLPSGDRPPASAHASEETGEGTGDRGPATAPDGIPADAATRAEDAAARSERPDGRQAFDAGPVEPDDDERFVPPEPPPLPRGDFITTFAWVCVLGGPLLLITAAVVWRDIPGELILTAIAAFIGGFVTLIARLPNDHTDDPDDGAVV